MCFIAKKRYTSRELNHELVLILHTKPLKYVYMKTSTCTVPGLIVQAPLASSLIHNVYPAMC